MKRPYTQTPNEYLTQSSLLLQAYPTTTRITTNYSIKPPPTAEQLNKKRKRSGPSTTTKPPDGDGTAPTSTPPSAPTDPQPAPAPPQPTAEEAVKNMTPRAYLTLKTYEPTSGICIKYRTDKEREVGRLMASLGKLGRQMAALPVEEGVEGSGEVERAVVGASEVIEIDEGGEVGGVKVDGMAQTQMQMQGGEAAMRGGQAQGAAGGAAGGGGGKKKKKGKK